MEGVHNMSTDTRTTSKAPLNAPTERGEYCEDVVPDTLDLAEHARYGLNYFTEFIRDDLDHEMYFGGRPYPLLPPRHLLRHVPVQGRRGDVLRAADVR